ncbi:MAG: glycosyltransferase [Bacteroidetes bacterium]|nr:MAG: glycosyltransferase [Bacteroidota bacterium]
MRLLVLTSRFPYPVEKGDKLRLFFQLRELARHHRVILVALNEGPVAPGDYQVVASLCEEVHVWPLTRAGIAAHLLQGLLSGQPLQVAYFFRRRYLRRLAALIARTRPDGLYCQLIRMAEYVRRLPADLPATLDYMDCFSVQMARQAERESPWRRPVYRREARLLGRYEAQVYPAFSHHTIISAQDRDLLGLSPARRAQVQVIPNGVDTDYFHPAAGPAATETHDLVFAGNMGYFPNVQAARYLVEVLMPRVWAQRPDTSLLLAGARPAPAVLRLAEDSRVEVSGWLEDIRSGYRAGRLFVAPLQAGSGQQNKILEALALGRPCLTTPLVNNAIGAEPERDLLLAEDPDDWVRQILRGLADTELRARLGRAGRAFVAEGHSWGHTVGLLRALWEKD